MRRVASRDRGRNDMRRKSLTVGGARSSVLWGSGGRGPRTAGAAFVAFAALLCLPLSAGARSFAAHHASARVPASLVADAKAHPQQMFDVIVQSTEGATSADAAGAVRASARSRVVKAQYRALHT